MMFLGAIPWRLLAVIGIVAGLALGAVYVTHQLKKIGKLEAQLDSAIDVGNANAEAARKATEDFQRVREVMFRAFKEKSEIRRKADNRKAQINAAPPSEDGPLAPVLRDTLNQLPSYTHPKGSRPDPVPGPGARIVRPNPRTI